MEGTAAPQPMRVDTRLVREQLVGRILAAAMERTAALPPETTAALSKALVRVSEGGAAPPGSVDLGDRLAALGYACRDVERELFEPARAPVPGLAAKLEGREPIDVATELASREPEGRPDPGAAPSWEVPGPGGHVRHYTAMDGAVMLGAGYDGEPQLRDDQDALALKRCWMLGFHLRCCEEA